MVLARRVTPPLKMPRRSYDMPVMRAASMSLTLRLYDIDKAAWRRYHITVARRAFSARKDRTGTDGRRNERREVTSAHVMNEYVFLPSRVKPAYARNGYEVIR